MIQFQGPRSAGFVIRPHPSIRIFNPLKMSVICLVAERRRVISDCKSLYSFAAGLLRFACPSGSRSVASTSWLQIPPNGNSPSISLKSIHSILLCVRFWTSDECNANRVSHRTKVMAGETIGLNRFRVQPNCSHFAKGTIYLLSPITVISLKAIDLNNRGWNVVMSCWSCLSCFLNLTQNTQNTQIFLV